MGSDSPVVQVEYEALDEIAQRFGERAGSTADLRQRLGAMVGVLADAGWRGEASIRFAGEMWESVLPAVGRLSDALEAAHAVTLRVKTGLNEAEQEAASLFQGGSTAAEPDRGEQSANEATSGPVGLSSGLAAGFAVGRAINAGSDEGILDRIGGGISDFFHGMWDEGADMIHGIGHMIRHPIQTAEGLWHAVTHPGETWDALKKPFVDAWESGHPFQAIGRGVVAVGSLLIGAHGADKVAEGARAAEVAETAARAERIADAGELGRASRAGEIESGAARTMPDLAPGARPSIPIPYQGVQSTKGILPRFNPIPGTPNCGRVASAVDRFLAGDGRTLAIPGQRGWPMANGIELNGSFWAPTSGANDIQATLQAAGDGARGMIYVFDSATSQSHVFNAVNEGGSVIAIDGQAEVMGRIPDVAHAINYGGSHVQWYWVRTG